MGEDYTRKLVEALASHKSATEVTRAGMRLLEEIKEDIEDLRTQDDLIRRIIMERGAPPANLRTTRPPGTATDLEQRQTIRETAIELAKKNPKGEVDIQEIVDRLKTDGVNLRVKKPASVVGSIVARTKGFTKAGWKKYKYIEVS